MVKELAGALFLLSIAIGYYVAAGGINRSALADEVGAAGLPIVYGLTLAVLALVLVAKTSISRRSHRADLRRGDDRGGELRKLSRAAGMLAIGVGYVAIISRAGYLLSLLGVIILVALYQGDRMSLRLAGIAIGGAVFFFVFFDLLLGIDMPAGIWPELAGR